jgi:hypothetical protein
VKNAKNDSGLCLLSALPAKTGQTLNRLPTQDFSALAGYMSTFRNRNLEKISLVSTFEKIYSAKMWLMSTFENENLKIIFFVSTFLDWYNFSCLLFLTGTNRAEKIGKM